jgi:hypothetical protein
LLIASAWTLLLYLDYFLSQTLIYLYNPSPLSEFSYICFIVNDTLLINHSCV